MRELDAAQLERVTGGWGENPDCPDHTVVPNFDTPSWEQPGASAFYGLQAMQAMNADGGGGYGAGGFGGGADLYLAGGGDQVAVSGLSGEGSYRGLTLSIGVGVEGQGGDNDIWLFLDGGAGIDLRDLSGASVGNLMRAVLGGAGVGGSAFVTTVDQDEGNPNGDFQWGAGANVFGAQLSVDRNGGIGGGGAIGTAQFGASVSGNAALNLSDMAAALGITVTQMLANWDSSVDALRTQTATSGSFNSWLLTNAGPTSPGAPSYNYDEDFYGNDDDRFFRGTRP